MSPSDILLVCPCPCDEFALVRSPWVDNARLDKEHERLIRIAGFVKNNCWDTCTAVDDSRSAEIIAELDKFNFCHVYYNSAARCSYNEQILRLLKWLIPRLVCLVLGL